MEFTSSICSVMSGPDLTISEIIKLAGGASAIERESGGSVTAEAAYKWPKIGIPDRHWPLIMRLTRATADQLFRANVVARAPSADRVAS